MIRRPTSLRHTDYTPVGKQNNKGCEITFTPLFANKKLHSCSKEFYESLKLQIPLWILPFFHPQKGHEPSLPLSVVLFL